MPQRAVDEFRFAEAKIAFVVKQGEDAAAVAEIHRKTVIAIAAASVAGGDRDCRMRDKPYEFAASKVLCMTAS
jgi:hypothetical protein